jgi:hypothetical protein
VQYLRHDRVEHWPECPSSTASSSVLAWADACDTNLVIVVGWLALIASALLWAWVSRRAIRANPTSTIPRLRTPAVRPSHGRLLNFFAVATTVMGVLLISTPTKRGHEPLWLAVIAVVGTVFVAMPIEIHNRRVVRSHGG